MAYCIDGIILTKIGPNTFCCCGVGCLPRFAPVSIADGPPVFEEVATLDYTDFYLLTDLKGWTHRALQHRELGIHVPDEPALVIKSVTPHRLWDVAHRVFLRPKPYDWHNPIPQILGLRVEYSIKNQHFNLIILCDYEDMRPLCGVRLLGHCPRKLRRAFDDANIVNSILWPDMGDVDHAQRIGDRHVDVYVGVKKFRIRVVLERGDYEMSTNPLQQMSPHQTLRPSDGNVFPTLQFSSHVIRLASEEVRTHYAP